MNVSVIIPSYNSHSTISLTLDNLLSQDSANLIKEIIIADSSDDKKTKELITEYKTISTLIKVIHIGTRVIPAIGRNLGAENSKGEILAFIDSDAYPAKNWIKSIVELHQTGCNVGGGSYAIPPFQINSTIAQAQYYLQFNEFFPIGKKRIKQFSPSCNIFCNRELFFKYGGFPEIRASEDVLFGLLVSKEESYWFCPDLIVFHVFRENRNDFARNQEILGKYAILYRKKLYKSLFYKGLFPVFLLPFFVIFKCFRIVLRITLTNRTFVYRFCNCIPTFSFGLICWSKGFYKGCFKENENT